MDSWIRNQEEVFGRGLNLGQQREQERIIKLLDECVCGASVEKCMTCECNERKIKRVDLIALIKGEK